MDAIAEDNQHGATASEDPVLTNLRVKAEAAMPFLQDGLSTYAIQRHTSSVSLRYAGSVKKYFAALLSLPIDGREGDLVAYIIVNVIVSLVYSFSRRPVLITMSEFY